MTHSQGKRRGLLALWLFGTLLFTALGIWQVQRLFWKRDLIARVEARIQAAPVTVPARNTWATLDPRDVEYRRVQARGVFRHDLETRVDALTELGAGAWLLTPLVTADGVLLVNRGFLASARTVTHGRPQGEAFVTGLLRWTEPGGRVLRPNDPAADRWFSRDVVAIGRARGLQDIAPFFVDADAGASGASHAEPVGGLTVVHFRNAHLAYAATWFALAGLCVAGLLLLGHAQALGPPKEEKPMTDL